MFSTAAAGVWLFNTVQRDAGAGAGAETGAEAASAPQPCAVTATAAVAARGSGDNRVAKASAEPAEPPYKIAYTAPELPPADVDWIAAAQRRKMLDRSATVMRVAARDDASGAPVVLQLYPLRTTDHALRKGTAPGGGSKNKWSSRAATPWPNLFWLMGPV